MTIALIPMGPVTRALVVWLADRLTDALQVETAILSELSLPARSYNETRRQYRGEGILDRLRDVDHPAAERFLGIVEADCYARELNFIFGQATMGGREAFVALPRLRSSFYGEPEDADLFRERVLKEAIHELGHTWGLSHCPNPKCVMHFSNSLRDTDVKEAAYCERCRAMLDRRSHRS